MKDDAETGAWPEGVEKGKLYLDGIYLEFQPELIGYVGGSCGVGPRGTGDNSPLKDKEGKVSAKECHFIAVRDTRSS